MKHMVNDALEEDPVVADQQHGGIQRSEIALQPAGGLEIEVIGGLVEKDEVCGGNQLLSQSYPAPLSTAQLAEWLGPSAIGIEAQAVQYGIDSGSQGIATLAIEPLEVAVVSGQHVLGAPIAGLGQRNALYRQRSFQL